MRPQRGAQLQGQQAAGGGNGAQREAVNGGLKVNHEQPVGPRSGGLEQKGNAAPRTSPARCGVVACAAKARARRACALLMAAPTSVGGRHGTAVVTLVAPGRCRSASHSHAPAWSHLRHRLASSTLSRLSWDKASTGPTARGDSRLSGPRAGDGLGPSAPSIALGWTGCLRGTAAGSKSRKPQAACSNTK